MHKHILHSRGVQKWLPAELIAQRPSLIPLELAAQLASISELSTLVL